MAALRKKLERDPKFPEHILTVKGFGYKLAVYPCIEKEVKLATPIPLQHLCELGRSKAARIVRGDEADPSASKRIHEATQIVRVAGQPG